MSKFIQNYIPITDKDLFLFNLLKEVINYNSTFILDGVCYSDIEEMLINDYEEELQCFCPYGSYDTIFIPKDYKPNLEPWEYEKKEFEDLEFFKMVNGCETYEDLSKVMKFIALHYDNKIPGGQEDFELQQQLDAAFDIIFKNDQRINRVTRNFGLRQQCLYIKFYN